MSLHPPKPVLTYRLGIAGTRDLGNADPGLQTRIGDFLDFIQDRICAIGKENSSCFDANRKPKLVLVCSLAKGVDLLVAKLAVARGFELHVPLAFKKDIYISKNFEAADVEDRASFDSLVKHAGGRILELDGNPSEADSAYDAAGTVLINNCDALLAIWDFGPGKGPGGTASSFEKAKDAGVLLVRMRPDSPDGPFFHDDCEDRPYEELKQQIRYQLLPGITSGNPMLESEPESLRRVQRERKRLQIYYAEPEHRFDFSWPYKAANAAFSLTKPGFSLRLPSYREQANQAWPAMSDETFTDSARDHFRGFDQWADGLAVFYANCTRSTVAVTVLLGAILLVYALALKLWPDAGRKYGVQPGAAVVEGLSLFALTGIVIIARWRSVNAKWLQYRMLSEFLRSAGLASAIGGLPLPYSRFHEKDTVAQTWVSFYFQAVVRDMGLLNATIDHNYLADFRRLLEHRLNGQITFHKNRHTLYQKIDRNIRRCGIFIFVVSFIGAVLHIVEEMVPGFRMFGIDLPRHVSNLSQLLPIFGGALAAFVSQESFGRLSHLSATIARRLDNVLRRVVTVPLNSDVLRRETSVAIDEMMAEHEEWFMLYSLRDIELPH